uniref:Peptidase A2 domain-containing protein n=1 Tax=Magallana gigas TaxID=29159 RepID=K1QTA1_MAGGI
MELDTGSAISVMAEEEFRRKFRDLKLKTADITLRTYSGEHIKPVGYMDVEVEYANDAYIVIACDVSDGTQITGDVEPLSQEKKQNGYMVAGIAGGIGFLAVCVIIGFMVEDDRRNLPKNEDTPGMNNFKIAFCNKLSVSLKTTIEY